MEANELRIGNYFIGYSNHLQQWELASFGLLIEGIEVDEIIRGFVPLTKEWLLKLGFEFESKDDYTNITYYQAKYKNSIKQTNIISIDSDGLLQISEEQDMINWSNLCTIKYVNQLQNLYFALTGEELKNS